MVRKKILILCIMGDIKIKKKNKRKDIYFFANELRM